MTGNAGIRRKSWVEGLRYAFGIGYAEPELTDADKGALVRLGDMVVARRLEVPAMMALESLRPMNFLGSQAMVALKPFIGLLTDETAFVTVQEALEKRSSVNYLIEYIEDRLNERKLAEKAGLKATEGDK